MTSQTRAPNKGGRPQFEPTDEQRRTVRAMVAYGVPLEDIAKVIGVDRKTLSKHFRQEIDTAAAEANAKVAQSLYKNAVEHNTTAAQIFWLKTKAGWRETQAHEISGPEGGPIEIAGAKSELLKRLTGGPNDPDEDEA